MIKQLQKHFYKLTSWLSIGAIGSLIPLSFATPTQAQVYPDIQGHWAEECISRLGQQGIVTGYPDGTFKPDDIITRAEYAALMNQAYPNINTERSAINFVDVAPSYWGYNAIRTAYQKEFLTGYPNDYFRPEAIIDRNEAFVALASGLGYNVPNNPQQILAATYQDAAEIPQYAEGQIAAATQQGIMISPPKPQFNQRLMGPTDPATRAQIAAAICETKEIEGVPPRYVVNPPQGSYGM